MLKKINILILACILLTSSSPVFASTNQDQIVNQNETETDQINVLFDEDISGEDISRFEEDVEGKLIKKDVLDYGVLCLFEVEETNDAIEEAMDNEQVQSAEENILLRPAAVAYTKEIANDTYSKDQWYFDTMQIENAWDVVDTYKKKKVRVALIDTGCEEIEDLGSNVNFNLYEDTSNDATTVPTDNNGHGTQVASIIASTANNHEGIAGSGSGWNNDFIEVIPYKTETKKGITVNAFQVAMDRAIKSGCDVINISLEVEVDVPGVKQAIDNAKENDVVVVAAAGNDRTTDETYPAAYDSVIGVSATDANNVLDSFSNHGDWISVAAPGNNIITATINDGYVRERGTSFSSSYVASIAAMIKAVKPELSADRIKNIIEKTATDTGEKGFDTETGYGIVNAWKAVKTATGDNSNLPDPEIKDLNVNVQGKSVHITHNSSSNVSAVITANGFSKTISKLPKSYSLIVDSGKTYTLTATVAEVYRYDRLKGTTPKKTSMKKMTFSTPAVAVEKTKITKAKITGISTKTYTGKAITLPIKVTINGKTLTSGKDYTVSYAKNKNVGQATVSIKGKGNYEGVAKKTFKIIPKTVNIKTLTSKNKKITVKWTPQTVQNDGYQIQYSVDKNFKSNTKTVTVPKNKQYLKELTGFSKNKTYYVRMRGFKKVGAGKYYSDWGKVRSVKVN